MGYTLAIGEKRSIQEDDGSTYYDVERIFHNKAPAFGEPTDHTNQRWPSCSTWKKFSEFTGLVNLFYDKDNGLINASKDGVVLIRQIHKKQIDLALEVITDRFPNAFAGYSPKVDDILVHSDPDWPEANEWLVRLHWLKYWVDWALENCKEPVFYHI